MYEETRTYTTTTRAEYQPYEMYETTGCGPQFDIDYLRTLPGMLKLAAIGLCFMCFLTTIVGGPGHFSGVSFATFVSVFGLSISLILLLLYVFHVVDQYKHLPIIVTEMIFCFVWTILFFVAGSILAVASVSFKGAAFWAVAAFFGFGAMCVYGLDCYLKFLAWKNNETASGGGTIYRAPQTVHV